MLAKLERLLRRPLVAAIVQPVGRHTREMHGTSSTKPDLLDALDHGITVNQPVRIARASTDVMLILPDDLINKACYECELNKVRCTACFQPS